VIRATIDEQAVSLRQVGSVAVRESGPQGATGYFGTNIFRVIPANAGTQLNRQIAGLLLTQE